QLFSVVTVLCGAGLILFPFLAWVTSGSVELSAFDGRSGNPTSGPRFGYLLFAIGVTLILAGLMRLRAKGLAEPGPNLLLSHCLLGAAVLALTMPLGIIISCFQRSGLDIGVGTWLTFAACLILIILGVEENRSRNAVGV
ncbi:MAG: hypothetical protein ACPG7Y_06405, partial [Acidimicrobiales bacterium]